MLLEADFGSGSVSVWLSLGSEVWGPVIGQVLVQSQDIKAFPWGSLEQIPTPPQGTTLPIITELTTPMPKSYMNQVAGLHRKGTKRSSHLTPLIYPWTN